jgi:hypothetical protein
VEAEELEKMFPALTSRLANELAAEKKKGPIIEALRSCAGLRNQRRGVA